MTRRVLCMACSSRWTTYAGSARLIYGDARQPTEEQRTVRYQKLDASGNVVSEEPNVMPLGFYNCDTCGAKIEPGERCGCLTTWRAAEGEPEPPLGWEKDYLGEIA